MSFCFLLPGEEDKESKGTVWGRWGVCWEEWSGFNKLCKELHVTEVLRDFVQAWRGKSYQALISTLFKIWPPRYILYQTFILDGIKWIEKIEFAKGSHWDRFILIQISLVYWSSYPSSNFNIIHRQFYKNILNSTCCSKCIELWKSSGIALFAVLLSWTIRQNFTFSVFKRIFSFFSS